jgi:hypothetical protein
LQSAEHYPILKSRHFDLFVVFPSPFCRGHFLCSSIWVALQEIWQEVGGQWLQLYWWGQGGWRTLLRVLNLSHHKKVKLSL